MDAGRDARIRRRLRPFALFLLCTLALTAVLPPSAYPSSSIGLSAGTYKFSTLHGKSLKGDLFVSNEGDRPIQVLVYTADVKTNEKGIPQFILPERGTHPSSNSPASWTTINAPDSTRIINNAPFLKLQVGERSHVFFTVDVPDKAPAGDYSFVIFFEMFNIGGSKGTSSRIGGRVGCRVRVRVQGKIVEAVSVRPFSVGGIVFGSELPYDFTVVNGGNVDHDFDSRLQLLTLNEEGKASMTIAKSDYIYARGKKRYSGSVPVRRLSLGKYVAELHVSYIKESMDKAGRITKSKDELVKTREFWVLPFSVTIPLAVLLLALVAAIGIAVTRRRRRQPLPHADQPQVMPPPHAPAWPPEPAPPASTGFGFGSLAEPAMAGGDVGVGLPIEMTGYSEAGEAEFEAEKTGEVEAETAAQEAAGREEPEEDPILFDAPKDAEERSEWKKSWGKISYYGPKPPSNKDPEE
ncbi:MAG: hypothetical protein C4521_02155 [Actinobacteria bacterium]|nr:MAG: hypothetical protein C4521_02155 [Actinomycetota bacterium]